MAVAPWIVSDELWRLVGPLLPRKERWFRYPGRKRLGDRQALQGILFVLHTGIAWRHLPLELGFGSGATCFRRLNESKRAGVWERLHELLLERLRAAGEIEWSRAIADSSPLAWTLTDGNRNDVTQLIPLVDAVPPVRGRPPERVSADRGCDHDKYRHQLRQR